MRRRRRLCRLEDGRRPVGILLVTFWLPRQRARN